MVSSDVCRLRLESEVDVAMTESFHLASVYVREHQATVRPLPLRKQEPFGDERIHETESNALNKNLPSVNYFIKVIYLPGTHNTPVCSESSLPPFCRWEN